MTRDEIKTIPAGRELDFLIAEHVMGWKRFPADPWTDEYARYGCYPTVPPRRTSRWETEDGICYQIIAHGGESGVAYSPLPSFSINIADAWRVVEHITRSSGHSDFHLSYDCGDPHEWNGVWSVFFPGATDASGETAPLAICRSALLYALENR